MSNILKKFKNKKEENVLLTNEDLEKYNKRIYELKDLVINCLNDIKINPNNKIACENLIKYTNEIKSIKKILKNANKVAKKNGK